MIRIVMAGNPNSGKTTVYNAITGRMERVGNWTGVTVEKKNLPLRKNIAQGMRTSLRWTFPEHILCHLSRRKKV